MTTIRVSKDESQPEKKMPRRWRKVAGFIFGMVGILLLGGFCYWGDVRRHWDCIWPGMKPH